VLRALPYPDADRLVDVATAHERDQPGADSWPDYMDWREQAKSFEGLAAYHEQSLVWTGGRQPLRLDTMAAAPNIFAVLGVKPALGRGFTDDAWQPGQDHVVVISHAAWQHYFHGDPDVIGTTMVLDDTPRTIIGVLPRDHKNVLSPRAEIWIPVSTAGDMGLGEQRGAHYMNAVGRLRSGITIAAAQAEMDTINDRLIAAYPQDNAGHVINVRALHGLLVQDLRPTLLVLLGAVGFVLLLACANVANLLLARATVRQRELSIRVALGASRGRVIRQMLTESVLLSLFGGGIGVLLALWGLDALRGLLPAEIARVADIGIDLRVLGFTAGVSVLTGVIFGIIPALHASGPNPNEALKDAGARTTGGGARQRARNVLVAGEIAVAMLLLVGAGLMLKSFARLTEVRPGFRAERVTMGMIHLPDTRYMENEKVVAFYKDLLPRLGALPGVESATMGIPMPFSHMNMNTTFTIDALPPPKPGERPISGMRAVSPSYFATLQIPLRAGRLLTEADDDMKAAHVALVNETFAKKYFPGEDPVGKHISPGWGDGKSREIVGVVGDVKYGSLEGDALPQMYVPFAQAPMGIVEFAVRTPATTGLAAMLTDAVRAADKDIPLGELKTMTQAVDDSLAGRRLSTLLLGIFGAVALLLALIGVYGVMSYTVTQRTQEIGIRVALGARPGDVVRMVVGRGMLLAGIGIVAGLVGALLLSRFLASLLFGVQPTDPATYAMIAGTLAVVALVASWLPARRAARVDPMIALRSN
jgi:putative ABC transport system permease protein